MADPTIEELDGYDEFIADASAYCRCCPDCWGHPCAGALAGGLCDQMHCRCDGEDDSDGYE